MQSTERIYEGDDMMNEFLQIGKVNAYVQKNADRDYTITLAKDGEVIAREIYFTSNPMAAVENFLQIIMDVFTFSWLAKNIPDLEKMTEDVYRSKDDIFCRIDGTQYFRHLSSVSGKYFGN